MKNILKFNLFTVNFDICSSPSWQLAMFFWVWIKWICLNDSFTNWTDLFLVKRNQHILQNIFISVPRMKEHHAGLEQHKWCQRVFLCELFIDVFLFKQERALRCSGHICEERPLFENVLHLYSRVRQECGPSRWALPEKPSVCQSCPRVWGDRTTPTCLFSSLQTIVTKML